MNAKETIPALAKIAPVLATAGPPALIGVGIGLALLWLLSRDEKKAVEQVQEIPPASPASSSEDDIPPAAPVRRIRREDLAEALAYGARPVTRSEAVATLQALGFGKTAAYKALSPTGRFADFINHSSDGMIEWKA